MALWPEIKEGVTHATKSFFEAIFKGAEEAATTAQAGAEAAATANVTAERERAEAAEALKAPLASPTLTGTPKAPTAAAKTNTTQIATTAFAETAVGEEQTRAEAAEALLAPLASPSLIGVPTAPTAAGGTNTTQIATTAFVQTASSGTSTMPVNGIPAGTRPSRPAITGTTYYVSATGSDSNAGTSEGLPWKTVKKVNEASLNPGDGVLFKGGDTFKETLELKEGASNGTEAKPIVISSYGGQNATLEPGVGLYPKHEWIVIDHLTLPGEGSKPGATAYGSNITFQNCNISSPTGVGLLAQSGEHGSTTVVAKNWKVLYNYIHNTGDSGIIAEAAVEHGEASAEHPGENWTIIGNIIENTGLTEAIGKSHGIYCKAKNSTIENNVIRNWQPEGSGVTIRYSGTTVANNVLENAAGGEGITYFAYAEESKTIHLTKNVIRSVAQGIYAPKENVGKKNTETFIISENNVGPVTGTAINIETGGGAKVLDDGTNVKRAAQPVIVESGEGTLSSGKATIKALRATTTSTIFVTGVSGTVIGIEVKERKAGEFIVEATATSSDKFVWMIVA